MCVRTPRRDWSFDRDTYTPRTSEELPSPAVKAAMIAERSDLVAGRADEPAASAGPAATAATAMTASTVDDALDESE